MTKSTVHSPLRVYGRSELALLYYGRPISDSRARKWLMEELSHHPELMERLHQLGLKKHGKTFSRDQVQAIFETIGEP